MRCEFLKILTGALSADDAKNFFILLMYIWYFNNNNNVKNTCALCVEQIVLNLIKLIKFSFLAIKA